MSGVLDRVVFDAEISERRILIVPIHTIKPTPYNPAPRTKEGAALRNLMDAIKEHGLVYPILITDSRDVADGNRRLMACRLLGHTHIECIVSEVARDDLFATVNTTPMPMASRGWLEIARGGRKVPKMYAEQYKELHGLIGTYGIDTLISRGLGMNSLALCKQVCALDGKYVLPEMIMKTALHKLTNKLNAIIRSDKSREQKVIEVDALLELTQ
jgi:hypothetical protein